MKINAIVTGTTGMVGEGVLHECLAHPNVERILLLSRRPTGVRNPKVQELLHADFLNLTPAEAQLAGYNACLFCLGISSLGVAPPEYERMTYDLTLHVAQTLARLNPDMTFCYVSGAGTDSTEQGRSRWARVKGRTENALLKLPFRHAYMFRPGFLKPTAGLRRTGRLYTYLGWLYPVLQRFFPATASTLQELGQAMINAVLVGYPKPVLEVSDIVALAHK